MKVSLVIPMYNESSIIDEALHTFSSYMEETFEDWELIFVDDGSADGCGNAVCLAHEKDERIRLCRYTPNRGKGYAVRTGVLAAQGDLILFTDCDNAYGTEALGTLAQTFMQSDADIVVGSRNLSKDGYEGYTFLRKLASKTYIKIIAVAAGFKLSDSQCGIKGFRHDIAKKIFSNCEVDRFAFDLEVIMIAMKLGAKIAEMPVKIINHRESTVHVLRDSVKMLRDVRSMKKRIKKQEIQ
ncbi:MAG: glycosyltransferase [Ruminococcaceae bacterium]|nr:glycosyltransferase [Oscillospiraceae bacterium]